MLTLRSGHSLKNLHPQNAFRYTRLLRSSFKLAVIQFANFFKITLINPVSVLRSQMLRQVVTDECGYPDVYQATRNRMTEKGKAKQAWFIQWFLSSTH